MRAIGSHREHDLLFSIEYTYNTMNLRDCQHRKVHVAVLLILDWQCRKSQFASGTAFVILRQQKCMICK